MLNVTEQLSKANLYLSPLYTNLTDSKVVSVAVTALSVLASAFSYFTLPSAISLSLASFSLVALTATAGIFYKLHQHKKLEEAKAKEAAAKAAEEAAKAALEAKKEPLQVQPGYFARFWRTRSDSEETGGAAAKSSAVLEVSEA